MVDTINRNAANWVRALVSNAMKAAPIQQYARGGTERFVYLLPDSLLLKWSEANGVDAIAASRSVPELPTLFLSDIGRTWLKQYMETYRARPLIQRLRRMVSMVDRLDTNGGLPCEYHKVVHAVAAVALGNRTREGKEFLNKVASVLDAPEQADEILATYEQVLTSTSKVMLSQVHDMLDGDYGRWVWARLEEALGWLRMYQPEFRIRQGERSALWDALWVAILSGGDQR